MNITSELYKKVIQYLNSELSLSQLEDWLLPNLGQILSLPSCPAVDLVGDIELGLAEMSNGRRTETEFRSMIRNLIGSSEIVILDEIATSPYSILSGTTNPAPIFLDDTVPIGASEVFYHQAPV